MPSSDRRPRPQPDGTAAPPTRRHVVIFLAVAFGIAVAVGLLLALAGVSLRSPLGIGLIALLFMPSPLVAALVAERRFVRGRVALPARSARAVLVFLLAPVLAALGAVVLLLLAMLLLGNAAQLVPGTVATTQEQVADGAAVLLGPAAVDAAGTPPPPVLLLLAGLWGAVVAGWTVNGLFAFGEEYGWRGLLWEALRSRGPVVANLLIGVAWGLWHAPLILQGYNYPGSPLLGVGMMVVFCTAMSAVLTGLRELTAGVLPAAAAHGAFNAAAPLLLILVPGTQPVLTGPVGLLMALALLVVAGLLWARVNRMRSGTTVVAPEAASEAV